MVVGGEIHGSPVHLSGLAAAGSGQQPERRDCLISVANSFCNLCAQTTVPDIQVVTDNLPDKPVRRIKHVVTAANLHQLRGIGFYGFINCLRRDSPDTRDHTFVDYAVLEFMSRRYSGIFLDVQNLFERVFGVCVPNVLRNVLLKDAVDVREMFVEIKI